MAKKRKPGISVLIATQNEEAMVSLCIRSFLEFGDELIIVDNGSTDQTKEIVSDLQGQYPAKIKFFDRPELADLYQNRQFAFEQSSYEWLLRADSDYIAYTTGEYSIMHFRQFLLAHQKGLWPMGVSVIQCNVTGDFMHTGRAIEQSNADKANREQKCVPDAIARPMLRFYRHFPFFGFKRRGRWEGVRFQRLIKVTQWPRPLWMHCNIKSNMNHFFRSERTNWRQLGGFKRYPTLHSYLESIVREKYGTDDFEEAASVYMQRHILPYLEPYDPEKYYPYPALVAGQMERNPIYKIYKEQGKLKRRFCGIDYPPNQSQND